MRLAFVIVTTLVLSGCDKDEDTVVVPWTDDFTVPAGEQAKIDAAAKEGNQAEGSYSYDENNKKLSITIAGSSFKCGIENGTSFVAIITELTATTMVWNFEGESGTASWTRVDEGGSGIVGIWHTTDPELYLVITADNKVQIFGKGEECVAERQRHPSSNCLEAPASSAAIVIDGDLSDWSAVGAEATLTDPEGDQKGDDAGGDLKALKVAYAEKVVYVYMQLAGAPSSSFDYSANKVYRLTIQGYNGLSLGSDIYYDAGQQSWMTSNSQSQIAFAVGADGIEWSIDISQYATEGFTEVEMIMVQAREGIDEMECAWFKLP